MENLNGPYLRELKLSDVYDFKSWDKHDSILYEDYNFIENTDEEIKKWYKWKMSISFSEYYAIIYDNRAIGYISLKNINKILNTATIGVAMDPKFTNRGIGTRVLNDFLEDLKLKGFRSIYLYVASYNKRALNVYKKLGFKKKFSFIMKFNNGYLDEKNEDFIKYRDCFKIMLNRTFFYAYKMEKKF